MHVHLDHFLARHPARVGDVYGYFEPIDISEGRCRDSWIVVPESRVAHPISEGKLHGYLPGIVIPVSNEDAFTITYLTTFSRVVDVRRCIRQPHRESLG